MFVRCTNTNSTRLDAIPTNTTVTKHVLWPNALHACASQYNLVSRHNKYTHNFSKPLRRLLLQSTIQSSVQRSKWERPRYCRGFDSIEVDTNLTPPRCG